MSFDRDKLERQIARQLDGDLNTDEALTLSRELIRDPAAHHLHDEYAAIDAAAALALSELFDGSTDRVDVDSWTHSCLSVDPSRSVERRSRLYRWVRMWWLAPGAAAAVVIASAVMFDQSWQGFPRPPATMKAPSSHDSATSAPSPFRKTNVVSSDGDEYPKGATDGLPSSPQPARHAAYDLTKPQRKVLRDIDRNVIGVVGEDGEVYWLNIDHLRTVNRPNKGAVVRAASHEM